MYPFESEYYQDQQYLHEERGGKCIIIIVAQDNVFMLTY